MSNNNVLNQALRRPIIDKSPFDAFITETKCKSFDYGNGDNSTIEGVNYMDDLIEKSAYQVKELAKKLKKSTVKSTVDSVHNFLTTNVQYQADQKLQKLRSPSCSWSVRKSGVDCKSFSIFAGALLHEMGINYAIRQVKQPHFYPDQFTHVYIVVPTNQNQSKNKPIKSYYVLDATVLDNQEVNLTRKKDKMSGLPYKGMMAPAGNITAAETKESQNFESSFPQFVKLGFSNAELKEMKQYMKKLQRLTAGFDDVYFIPTPNGILLTDGGKNGLTFKPSGISLWQQYYNSYMPQAGMGIIGTSALLSSTGAGKAVGDVLGDVPVVGDIFDTVFGGVGDLVGSLFGSDRGWYKTRYVEREAKKLLEFLRNHTKTMNEAVQSKDMAQLGKAIANFRLEYKLFLKSAERQKSRDWNTPTEKNLAKLIDGLKKLIDKIEPALDNWISKNFDVSSTRGSVSKNSSFYDDKYKKSPFQYSNKVKHSEPIPQVSIKRGVSQINAFAITGEGDAILKSLQPEPQPQPQDPGNDNSNPNPTVITTPSRRNQNNNNGRNGQTAKFNNGPKEASLIPGVPNYLLLGGGVAVAGILLYPEIKSLISKK